MSLRSIFGTAPYEREMTPTELQRELDQERLFHRLNWKTGSSVALCACGYLFQSPRSRSQMNWRFDLHVKEAVTALRERLEGRLPYES